MDKQSIKVKLRRANERGHANHGWLDSYHTFSFAHYYDSEHMGFRSLRVINDDTVNPQMGFGMHSHRDMEIISFVVKGSLKHEDSMGHGSVIKEGNVQRISAGSGIFHSEYNDSSDENVHFLQIWLEPNARGLKPSYEEINVHEIDSRDGLKLIGSPTGEAGSVTIQQDAYLYYGNLVDGELAIYKTDQTRGLWLQVIDGSIFILNQELSVGDGLSVENVKDLHITARASSQFLLFDLK